VYRLYSSGSDPRPFLRFYSLFQARYFRVSVRSNRSAISSFSVPPLPFWVLCLLGFMERRSPRTSYRAWDLTPSPQNTLFFILPSGRPIPSASLPHFFSVSREVRGEEIVFHLASPTERFRVRTPLGCRLIRRDVRVLSLLTAFPLGKVPSSPRTGRMVSSRRLFCGPPVRMYGR